MFEKKKNFVLSLAIVAILAVVSYGALIGVQPSYPLMTYDNQGTLDYSVGSGQLLIDASPVGIRFPGQRRPSTIYPTSDGSRFIRMGVQVDTTGALVGGVAGDDIIVMGKVNDGTTDYEGVLLTGEIDQFGYLDSGGVTDMFDFKFYVTGGLLANFYLVKDIGVQLWSENSTFVDNFAVDFSGGAKGNAGPIDAVCSLDLSVEGCVMIPPPPVTESDCEGKLTKMTLVYTGLGCDASSHSQKLKKVNCFGNPVLEQPVSILVTDKKGKKIWASKSNVNIGDSIEVDVANAVGKKKHNKEKHNRNRHLGSQTKVTISNASGMIQEVIFHTSCSQPLNVGDQFGSVRITAMTSTKGGDVVYEEPEEEICITELPYVEPPHCEGKLEYMQLRYTGEGCDSSSNTQDPDQVTCVGDANSTSPVRIVATDTSGNYVYLDTGTASVNLGGLVDVDAFNAVLDTIRGETKVMVYNANDVLIEEVLFHTSCSQPLNIGDRFGSLEVFSMYNTEEGYVAEEMPVTYTYTITNNGRHPLTNVSVLDDIFGVVPGGPIVLAPGETAELMLDALISSELENTATATGLIGDLVLCEAIGSAIITEAAPSAVLPVCETKIKAMLLKYTGPDILNATVTIVASNFSCKPVVYTGVDLTSGTILSSPLENGYTIDASVHNKRDLGSKTTIYVNDGEEVLHTSCSNPFTRQAPAPLDDPKGDPSDNWFVVEFTEKE